MNTTTTTTIHERLRKAHNLFKRGITTEGEYLDTLQKVYEAAVDFKYDNCTEGTPEWQAADSDCDVACMALVQARQAARS